MSQTVTEVISTEIPVEGSSKRLSINELQSSSQIPHSSSGKGNTTEPLISTPSSLNSTLHGTKLSRALFVYKSTLQLLRSTSNNSRLIFRLLLSVIETTITATALVSIGNYFQDPIKATWVVVGYLLAYMGFAVIFARLSDGIGRRDALILSWLLFGGFSLGAGLAQTLNQLIGFRIMQGIGGSGLYTMTFVVGPTITPVKFIGLFSSLIGITYAIGSTIGPILGGVITQKSTWRWMYLFNAPCTVVRILLCICFLATEPKAQRERKVSIAGLKSIDYAGAMILLAASALLVFALQEAGSAAYAWSSSTIIAILAISAASWFGFFGWISYLTYGERRIQRPIIPMSVMLNRPTGPAILVVLLSGFTFFIAVINLPQRFQIVYGDSPILAGVHLLPLLCSVAVGSAFGAGVSSKKNITSYTSIVAFSFIIVGCGLFSTISNSRSFDRAIYGYEVILGFGNGLTFSSITMMVSLANTPENNAAAQGVVSQTRVLGDSIGLSIATIVFNADLSKGLSSQLSTSELQSFHRSLSTISSLDPGQRAAVIQVYAESFNKQVRICTYVAIFGLLAAIATWQKHPVSIEVMRQRQVSEDRVPQSQNAKPETVDRAE
ncbi:putative MFS multidrug transporter [Tothia fuscella]|uniref:MFS multidrug transporter n=1 Tax=Tothia fuscella TaxID=1048955 RepID=A0A9P4NW12_9PEZI|nr:putative MFS multidrug transporter [Tothia fuscella]